MEVGDSTVGGTSVTVTMLSSDERTDWAPGGEVAERPLVVEMGGGTFIDLLDDLRRRREGSSRLRMEGLAE